MQVLKVTTDGEASLIEIEEPLYKGLQQALNGHFEHVHPRRLSEPYCMIVDEEGLLKELPLNNFGCYLYETYKHGHPIVGDVLIMKDGYTDDGPDLVGLTDEDYKFLHDNFVGILNF